MKVFPFPGWLYPTHKMLIENKNKNRLAEASHAISESYRTQSFTDMSISAGESVFRCHRIVIANAITKLKPYILQQMSQGKTPSLTLETDPFIVKHILEFVYNGYVEVPSDYLDDVIRAANYYGVIGLRSEPTDAPVIIRHFIRANNQEVGSPEASVPQAPSISPSYQRVVGNISTGRRSTTPFLEYSSVAYQSQTYQSCSSETQNDRGQSVSPCQGESCSQPGETAMDPERMVGYMLNGSINFDWYFIALIDIELNSFFYFLNHLQAAAYDSDDSDCELQIDEERDTVPVAMQSCEGKNMFFLLYYLP